MKKKKIIISLVLIIGIIILIIGISIYKKEKSTNSIIKQNNNQKTTSKIIEKVYKNETLGEVTSANGISHDIYNNTQYLGISDSSEVKNYKVFDDVTGKTINCNKIIYYYNPNILTKETLVKFFNKKIKNSNPNDRNDYFILDIYNQSFGISMNNHPNKFNELMVGNIGNNYNLIDNDRLLYCGIKENGQITSYYDNSKNFGKVAPFILKN
ncbi:hypothetical protein [Clostridium thermobutyricum]|uniref:hypothetical protein n=1 Tax=Clostridium thermobutyricum TaxID=29372 RepID=UPI0018AC1D6D|nr:hypothetical protein [Clostridium thermobutyricum]